MFSGVQEIFVVLLIVLGLFFIPRMMNPHKVPPKVVLRRASPRLSGALRLAVVLSLLWPLACAAYFRPWQNDALAFAVIGMGPVVVGWCVHWIVAGMKKT